MCNELKTVNSTHNKTLTCDIRKDIDVDIMQQLIAKL